MKDVLILTGAGQIGLAIARRMGSGKAIIVADCRMEQAFQAAKLLTEAGFEAYPVQMDLSDRNSIRNMIKMATSHGPVGMLVNAAGVWPSQAPVERILAVDLYGTAVLLEEVGKVIRPGGARITGRPDPGTAHRKYRESCAVHEGSGTGKVKADLEKLCPGAQLLDGISGITDRETSLFKQNTKKGALAPLLYP